MRAAVFVWTICLLLLQNT